MNDNSPAGLFIFLGILGVGIFLASRQGGSKSSHARHSMSTGWELVSPGNHVAQITPHEEYEHKNAGLMMENEERTEYIRGEDGLIKEKIVHRKVVKYA